MYTVNSNTVFAENHVGDYCGSHGNPRLGVWGLEAATTGLEFHLQNQGKLIFALLLQGFK